MTLYPRSTAPGSFPCHTPSACPSGGGRPRQLLQKAPCDGSSPHDGPGAAEGPDPPSPPRAPLGRVCPPSLLRFALGATSRPGCDARHRRAGTRSQGHAISGSHNHRVPCLLSESTSRSCRPFFLCPPPPTRGALSAAPAERTRRRAEGLTADGSGSLCGRDHSLRVRITTGLTELHVNCWTFPFL